MKEILEKMKVKGIGICIFVLLFSMNVMAASNSDYFENADNISTMGSLVSGELSSNIVKKAYIFTTSSDNSYYKVTGINPNASNYINFGIYDATGANIEKVTANGNGQNNFIVKLEKSTRYYILVEPTFSSYVTGNYKVSVTEIKDDVEDGYQLAEKLTLGKMASRKSEVESDVDYYKFNTTADNNCFYKISLINSDMSIVYIDIYDENMVVIEENSRVWENKQNDYYYRMSRNKTYYIKVKGSEAGNYKLLVERFADDVKDTYSEATSLTLNKSTSSGVQCREDVDYFKFKTNNLTTAYTLNLINKASGGYIEAQVYDRNMITVGYSFGVNAGRTQNSEYTLKKNSTYYIKITGNTDSNYTLKVKCDMPKSYKIIYKLNGGTNNSSNPSSYIKSQTVNLKNPTRKGYVFKGWYTDKSCKNRIKKISKGSTKKYTVYARWSKISLKRCSIRTLKNSGKGKLQIKISSVNGCKGYEIVIASNKKMTANKVIYTSSKNSKTISKLSKGTYYIKVRAYAKDSTGNKVYGKYSTVKKMKITK